MLSKANGKPEKKEVLLEDQDPVWLELRHAHIAEVSTYAWAFSAMQLLTELLEFVLRFLYVIF